MSEKSGQLVRVASGKEVLLLGTLVSVLNFLRPKIYLVKDLFVENGSSMAIFLPFHCLSSLVQLAVDLTLMILSVDVIPSE